MQWRIGLSVADRNAQLAAALHRIARIMRQVEQRRLQLRRIGEGGPCIRRAIDLQRDGAADAVG
jgi:hypothetical protein